MIPSKISSMPGHAAKGSGQFLVVLFIPYSYFMSRVAHPGKKVYSKNVFFYEVSFYALLSTFLGFIFVSISFFRVLHFKLNVIFVKIFIYLRKIIIKKTNI